MSAAASQPQTTSSSVGSVDQWATDVVRLCREKNFTPNVALTAAAHRYIPRPHDGLALPQGVVRTTVSSSTDGHETSNREGTVTAIGTVVTGTDFSVGASAPPGQTITAADPTPDTLSLPQALVNKAYRLELPCRVAHPVPTAGKKNHPSAAMLAPIAQPGTPQSPTPQAAQRESVSMNCVASPHCFYGLQSLQSDAQTLSRCADFLVGPCPSLLPDTPPPAVAESISAGAGDPSSLEACRVTPSSACLWRGLRNLGNTCYFNAVLQMLFALTSVRRAILAHGSVAGATTAMIKSTASPTNTHTSASATGTAAGSVDVDVPASTSPNAVAVIDLDEEVSELASSGLKEIFAQMAFLRGDVERGADPHSFVQYLGLDTAVQQDAQEFFALLVDWLRCHCGPTVKAATDATIGGTFMYDRHCGACGRAVKRAEPFLSLSVPVRASLDDSLASFLTPESVEDVACEGCGKRATATSYQYLRTLPDVLIIHLNRFEFDLQTLQRRKVNTAVRFPTVLDLTPYERQWHDARQQQQQQAEHTQTQLSMQNSDAASATASAASSSAPKTSAPPRDRTQLYELEGIVNHLGDSAHTGHYTYHGKVCAGGTATQAGARPDVWLDFNDATVSPLKPLTGPVCSSPDAYILVYRRVTAPTAASTSNVSTENAPVTKTASSTTTVPAISGGDKPVDAVDADVKATTAPKPARTHSSADASEMVTATATADQPPRPSTAPRMINPTPFDHAPAAATEMRATAAEHPAARGAVSRFTAPTAEEFPSYLLDYVTRLNWSVVEQRRLWCARRTHVGKLLATWAKVAATVMTPTNAKDEAEALYAMPTDWIEAFGRAFLPAFVNVRALNESATTTTAAAGAVEDFAAATLPPAVVPAVWQKPSATAPLPGGASAATAASTSLNTLVTTGQPLVIVGPHYRAAEEASRAALDPEDPTDNMLVHAIRSFSLNLADVPFSFTCSHGAIAPWAPYKVLTETAVLALHAFFTDVGVVDDADDPDDDEASVGRDAAAQPGTAARRSEASALSAAQERFLCHVEPFRLCAGRTCALCVAATAAKVELLAQNSRADAQALEMLHANSFPLDEGPPPSSVTAATATPQDIADTDAKDKAPTTDAVEAAPNTDADAALADEGQRAEAAAATAAAVKAPSQSEEDVYVYVSDDLTLAWETYVEAKRRWQKSIVATEGFTAVFTLLRCGEEPAWGSRAATASGFSGLAPTHSDEVNAVGIDGGLNGAEAQLPATSIAAAPDAVNQSPGHAKEHGDDEDDPTLPAVGSTVPSTTRNPIHGLIEALAPSASSSGLHREEAARVDEPEVTQQLLCPHGSIRPEATVRVVPERLRQYWLRRLPSILNAENQRGGLILSSNPTWTIDAVNVERYLLPFLPVSTMKQRCPLCVVESVRLTTDRHARRLAQVAESRRFPTLWRAGHFTSPATLAHLRAALGADIAEDMSDEQLLQTQHPNRAFFKRAADKEYREYVKKWSVSVSAEIASKEADVHYLRRAAQKEREHERLFASRLTSRGRNSGGGRKRGGGGVNSPTSSSATTEMNPHSATAQLAAAEAALASLKASLAEASPPFTEYYGCLPTWWVARWFSAVREATQFVQDGVAEEHDRIARMQSGISATAIRERREAAHHKTTTSSRGGVPPLSYKGWLCPHGGALLELAWLNPADPFWQGRRSKSAELIWHPEWAAQQHTQQTGTPQTPTATPTGVSSTTIAAGAPRDNAAAPDYRADTHTLSTSSSAVMSTNTDGSPSSWERLNATVDGHTLCWLPPMLIVPMDEFVAVLKAYGDWDMVQAVDALTAATTTSPEAGTAVALCGPTASALPLLVVEEKGVRHLQPRPCAERCHEALLAEFEENRAYFTRGTLKLTLHIRKSKKNFYDATGTLTSSATAKNTDPSGSGDGGIHHYTTLRQLRVLMSEYIMREHGYLVPPESLEISRNRNKPLKRVQPQEQPTRPPTSPLPAPSPTEAADTKPPSPTSPDASEQSPLDALPPKDDSASARLAPSDLDNATLFELGIHDGGSLFVQLTDSVATACASTVNRSGQEEVWQTIPPELLQESAGGGEGGARSAAALAATERRAFTETRLAGDGKRTGPAAGVNTEAAEDVGQACPVCTFINAPGMVRCEICEAPLPQ